jgi:hypothetical protein
MHVRIFRGLVILALVVTSGVVGSASSRASTSTPRSTGVTPNSATGFQLFGSACVTIAGVKICWPGGVLGHSIVGTHRTITNEEASVEDLAGVGVVGGIYCNWRIDAYYYDTNGTKYLTRSGTQHSACTAITDPPIGQKWPADITLAHDGKACAQFGANGKVYAKQCHNITG